MENRFIAELSQHSDAAKFEARLAFSREGVKDDWRDKAHVYLGIGLLNLTMRDISVVAFYARSVDTSFCKVLIFLLIDLLPLNK